MSSFASTATENRPQSRKGREQKWMLNTPQQNGASELSGARASGGTRATHAKSLGGDEGTVRNWEKMGRMYPSRAGEGGRAVCALKKMAQKEEK